jgi:tetratricopeptide (TPR) repeat protein
MRSDRRTSRRFVLNLPFLALLAASHLFLCGIGAAQPSVEQFQLVSADVRLDNELCRRAFMSKDFTAWKASYQSGQYEKAEKQWAALVKQISASKSCGRLISRARDTIDLNMPEDQSVDALKLYKHFHKATDQSLGPHHPALASIDRFIAQELEARKNFKEALIYRKMEIAIREKALGKTHPYAVSSLQDLAQHYIDQKKFTDALPILELALARWTIIKNQTGIKETARDYYVTLKTLGKNQQAQEVRSKYRLSQL